MADPFASLVYKCRYSDSQDDLLRYSQFCRESEEGLVYFPCEESSVSERIPVASVGITICSLPESSVDKENLPEEEFQTPEERLLVSSQEHGRNLDEHVDPKIDDADGNSGAMDSAEDVSPDLARTVDLDKDTNIVFAEEKSPPEKGFSTPRTDSVGGLDASGDPFGGAREDRVPECESRILKRKSLAQEDLGFPESKGDGSGEFPSEKLRNLNKKLHWNFVADAADTCAGGGLVKLSQSPTEKNIGFLKSKGDSPCKSASKSPVISRKISTPAYRTNKIVEVAKTSTGFNGEISLDKLKSDYLVVHPFKVLDPGDNGGVPKRVKETTNENSPLKSIENEVEVDTSTGKVLGLDHPQTHEEHNDERGNSTNKHSEKLENPSEFRRLPKWVDGIAENAIGGSVWGRTAGEAEGSGRGVRRRVGESEDSNRDRRRMGELESLGPGGRKDIESSPSENLPRSFMSLMDIINRIRDRRRMGGSEGSEPGERRRVVEASSSVNPPQLITNLLEAISGLSKEVDPNKGDVDILEVAVRAGVNFPRPRWWRSEGY